MENDELDELCKKITGKSYDQMLDEISKHPYKVMSFSIDSTPEGFVITTEVKLFAYTVTDTAFSGTVTVEWIIIGV